MKTAKPHPKKKSTWQLRLYVANRTPRSLLAMANLERLCERYLKEGYRIRVIDIQKCPSAASRNNILATPTLVRVAPKPRKTVIGCLSDPQAVLRSLDLSAGNGSSQPGTEKIITVMQEVGAA